MPGLTNLQSRGHHGYYLRMRWADINPRNRQERLRANRSEDCWYLCW